MGKSGLAVATVMMAAVTVGGATAATVTERFTSFMVLGDSLSDPGNLFAATGGTTPASPPYFEGRFSNDPVWAEGIAEAFRAEGRATGNVAFGGATAIPNADDIPDLPGQVSLITPTLREHGGARPVAALWFGANDLFTAQGAPDISAVGVQAAEAVTAGARALAGEGVRDFVIFNLPDLGTTPRYALFEPAASAAASAGSRAFNAALDDGITGLRDDGLKVQAIDIAALFDGLQAEPGRYGVSDATLPCLFPSQGAAAAFGQSVVCGPDAAQERAFYDPVHPNSVVHDRIGGIVGATIAPVPLPVPGLLLGGAILMLAAVRRGGRAMRPA